MTEHRLKILPEFYDPVVNGEKTFEVRLNDRGYQVGDVLVLCEWWPEGGFSGPEVRRVVSFIYAGVGMEPNYVCMSIAKEAGGAAKE